MTAGERMGCCAEQVGARHEAVFNFSPVLLLTCSVFEQPLENGEGGIRTPYRPVVAL